MPAGINRAGSRGGSASVMVAVKSFERVSALGSEMLVDVGARHSRGIYENYLAIVAGKCDENASGASPSLPDVVI
jgi:hypothetical protein